MCPRVCCKSAVERVADTSRQNLGLNIMFFIHSHDIFDEVYTLKSNVVQAAYEGAYSRRASLRSQYSLVY